jgi:cyclohexyl-isocyanide hydratase
VKDGNIITVGGVTSGIDFGLRMVAEIAGATIARAILLDIDYDLSANVPRPRRAV